MAGASRFLLSYQLSSTPLAGDSFCTLPSWVLFGSSHACLFSFACYTCAALLNKTLIAGITYILWIFGIPSSIYLLFKFLHLGNTNARCWGKTISAIMGLTPVDQKFGNDFDTVVKICRRLKRESKGCLGRIFTVVKWSVTSSGTEGSKN